MVMRKDLEPQYLEVAKQLLIQQREEVSTGIVSKSAYPLAFNQ
ncbi:hypothetical protein J056_002809 [Wallemia ichthyophaga EXF-994]|uniref:Uncharacterized protein n=1 Tax=Wallemia ichthyophaga (strain EXF-994 / CBS 113033) TaxID=1299270 RepID=R9A9G7_WALI9|nr:uncharacterized protein J056_002809 [Wallemia ichthyophaga EXF-994]EOQ98811.1 hypothetical protein J056_002809 [Wallemia ichthyophaga EXF-994]